jgi:hypothetical protein
MHPCVCPPTLTWCPSFHLLSTTACDGKGGATKELETPSQRDARHRQIFAVLVAQNADIMFLQEVDAFFMPLDWRVRLNPFERIPLPFLLIH